MLRITLNKPYRTPIGLRFGYESVTPMDFGSITPEITNEFRGQRKPSPSVPRIWTMDYNDDSRSILAPNEVAVHYFGDWRAGSDAEAVAAKLIPDLNNERERVANVWGGYFLSDKHGLYTTVKIAVPEVPDVTIEAVNNSGTTVGDWKFEPLAFFKFEDYLDANASQEMAEILARRGKVNMTFDLKNIPDDQLDALAEMLAKRKTAAAK